MRKFLSRLADVFHALCLIAVIAFAQYLASEPAEPLMLVSETETDIEVVDMVCPIKGGCEEINTVASTK